MIVKTFVSGWLSTNCYVVACERTKDAIIVDPGFDNIVEAKGVFKFIDQGSFKLKYIVNTHGHPDHTCGNGIVKGKFNVPIYVHENDVGMLGEPGIWIANLFGFKETSPPADGLLRDGDTVMFGNVTLKVLHTPGHSPGSISLIGEREVFTGDTLFAGSIGRTDLPGSSELEMELSLRKLADLPDRFIVYAGHGPITTIGDEKLYNPFLRRLRS